MWEVQRSGRRKLHRTPWWRRRVDERKLGIFGTRAGVTLLICVIIKVLSTPWLLVLLLTLAACGALAAIIIRSAHAEATPSLFR